MVERSTEPGAGLRWLLGLASRLLARLPTPVLTTTMSRPAAASHPRVPQELVERKIDYVDSNMDVLEAQQDMGPEKSVPPFLQTEYKVDIVNDTQLNT